MPAAASAYPYLERPDDELSFLGGGVFERGKNRMQKWVLPASEHPPAANRYHLYLNYACGWSHQCLVARALKGLQHVITVSHTYQRKRLIPPKPTGNGFATLRDVYNANNEYGDEQITVPVLFDKVANRVVSNDPAHILLMLNEAFDEWATEPARELYPAGERARIEEINAVVWPGISDGFYRCIFAKDDVVWAASYRALAAALAYVDGLLLEEGGFLCGAQVTLADVRLFPHLVRFDSIYRPLLLAHGPSQIDGVPPSASCTLSPATLRYVQRMFELPGVRATCDPQLALHGYYGGLGSFAPVLMARRGYYGSTLAIMLRNLWRRAVRGKAAAPAEWDAMYEERKYEWMPSIAALEQKRAAEDLPATAAEHVLLG
jgi:putative glutathione S-transferase